MIRSRPSRTLAATLTLAITTLGAAAQVDSHPEAQSPLKPNPYLKHQYPWRWDLRAQTFIRSGSHYRFVNVQEPGQPPQAVREEQTIRRNIETFEFIYPLMRNGGFYWTPNEEVTSVVRINDAEFEPTPDILQTPDTNVKYTRLFGDFKNIDEDGYWRVNQFHYKQLSHIVVADTVFNEKLAKQLPWPDTWPDEAARFTSPLIDQIDHPINLDAQDDLCRLVNVWIDNNDPKSIDEVTLVKYLTGKVLEYVKVVRGRREYAPVVTSYAVDDLIDAGFPTASTSRWSGLYVRSADDIVRDPRGTELDFSTMLVSVLRIVGVPARVVVAYDLNPEIIEEERIVGLVEFALYDPDRDQLMWIPIDPERLRDNGRRADLYQQPWDDFGTHDSLHNIIPLSHYYHPPVNYDAYGWPALYGFRYTPGNFAWSQIQLIDAQPSENRPRSQYPERFNNTNKTNQNP